MKIENQITFEIKSFDNIRELDFFLYNLSSSEKADWKIIPENIKEQEEIEISRHYQKHLNNLSRIERLENQITELEYEGTEESAQEIRRLNWQIKKLKGE